MKLHEHFLKEDLYQASKEFHCFKDCLALMVTHVEHGNIEKAKQRSIDVTKSLHELSKLAEKKNDLDRRQSLVNRLQEKGVNVQIVRRFFND